MDQEKVETLKNETGIDYVTIKTTKSRIDKGLLAIPVSLITWFPKEKGTITVFLDENNIPETKHFTPYNSSSRECRIGGLGDWFRSNDMQDSDEIVIQFLNPQEKVYRLFKETTFLKSIKEFQMQIRHAENEDDADMAITNLAKITNLDRKTIIESEFIQLSNQDLKIRNYKNYNRQHSKENVSGSIRIFLTKLYQGHCQISNFTFIQKNGKPYFEIHHIRPELGNHIKNLLVVSPNVHAQFTYANCEEFFDEEEWLRRVKFNEIEYGVKQFIDEIKKREFTKQTHIG